MESVATADDPLCLDGEYICGLGVDLTYRNHNLTFALYMKELNSITPLSGVHVIKQV